MNGLAGLSPEELREAVRAVLREVLPAGVAAPPSTPSSEVVMATEADLTAFVRRVAAMCEDAEVRAALQEGRHGFRLQVLGFEARKLAPQPANRQPGSSVEVRAERASKPTSIRVERGAVTERTVVKAAAERARIVLGRRAVLTPLARDKARALGVEIEKED